MVPRHVHEKRLTAERSLVHKTDGLVGIPIRQGRQVDRLFDDRVVAVERYGLIPRVVWADVTRRRVGESGLGGAADVLRHAWA